MRDRPVRSNRTRFPRNARANRGRYPYGNEGFYATINSMKEPIQIPPSHYSYQVHRRQFWLQIFLPIILAVLAILVVAVLLSISALNGTGDSVRWAAISTIWLLIPTMVFGLIFLIVLVGVVFLLSRGLEALPNYTSMAQYYVNRAGSAVKRFSDGAAKPFIFLNSVGAGLKEILGRF